MARVTKTQIVEAPISRVWASWDKFADIKHFHPDLKDSYLLDQSEPTGLGATRQCDFSDGKTVLRERIVEYTPERRIVIDIYESSVPLRSALATLEFKAMGERRTKVTMQMDFVPKMGIVGKLLIPMMKKQFAKGLSGLLAGNAAYVERMAG